MISTAIELVADRAHRASGSGVTSIGVAAAAGEHHRADDREHEQRRGDLERPEEVGEQRRARRARRCCRGRRRRRGSASAAGGLGAGGPLVAGEEQHLGEQDRRRARSRPAAGTERVVQRVGAVDAEQHDHEQEQHDDRAGVDDDLHRREQVRRRCWRKNTATLTSVTTSDQRRVHRVAREHDAERAGERRARRTRRR